MQKFFLIVLALSFSSLAFSQSNKAADASNQFGFNLYKFTSKEKDKENIFFSPFSIEVALAMTTAGAKKETLKQMLTVLHLDSNYHSEFKALLSQLKENKNFELFIANRIWGQSGNPYYPDFLNLLRKNYNADLVSMNFKGEPDPSRIKINEWVQEQTKDKIKDLLSPGLITASTDLVLTNAMYFKGSWVYSFDKENTKDGEFQVSTTQKKLIPFMHLKKGFGYTENSELQYLQLPYKGDQLVMDIILPKPEVQLSSIEQKLSTQFFTDLTKQAFPQEVYLSLPKFKAESELKLAETLKTLGMPLAFNREMANFEGIRKLNPTERLYISAVVHKAFVDVNEEGTEAAAATAVVVDYALSSPPPPKIFKANRPFLFFIRHLKSNTILFMGRYSQP